jgi:hypothetical protein
MGVATNRRMSTPGSDEGQAPQRESANARFAGRSDSPVSAGRDAWSSSFAQASPALPIGSATPPGSTSASSGWGLPPPFRRTGFGSRAWVPRGPAFRAKRDLAAGCGQTRSRMRGSPAPLAESGTARPALVKRATPGSSVTTLDGRRRRLLRCWRVASASGTWVRAPVPWRARYSAMARRSDPVSVRERPASAAR